MPLQRRVPKFGFKNINRKDYQGINLDKLQELVDNKIVKDTITFETLVENRLARKKRFGKDIRRRGIKSILKSFST